MVSYNLQILTLILTATPAAGRHKSSFPQFPPSYSQQNNLSYSDVILKFISQRFPSKDLASFIPQLISSITEMKPPQSSHWRLSDSFRQSLNVMSTWSLAQRWQKPKHMTSISSLVITRFGRDETWPVLNLAFFEIPDHGHILPLCLNSFSNFLTKQQPTFQSLLGKLKSPIITGELALLLMSSTSGSAVDRPVDQHLGFCRHKIVVFINAALIVTEQGRTLSIHILISDSVCILFAPVNDATVHLSRHHFYPADKLNTVVESLTNHGLQKIATFSECPDLCSKLLSCSDYSRKLISHIWCIGDHGHLGWSTRRHCTFFEIKSAPYLLSLADSTKTPCSLPSWKRLTGTRVPSSSFPIVSFAGSPLGEPVSFLRE